MRLTDIDRNFHEIDPEKLSVLVLAINYKNGYDLIKWESNNEKLSACINRWKLCILSHNS